MYKWKRNVYCVGTSREEFDDIPNEPEKYRRNIEPWLSAVFQSEHLSLLLGNGFTKAIASAVDADSTDMDMAKFNCDLEEEVNAYAEKVANASGRGKPNIEDQIRSVIALITGLEIMGDDKSKEWKLALNNVLSGFLNSILATESVIRKAIDEGDEKGPTGQDLLISFLLSFVSRTASRERLNLFTTNYDRLIEYGCDMVGLRVVDRFVGGLSPIFRSSRVDVDLHYNPPGIRGEPRYLEGVVKLTKLHGSIDWRSKNSIIQRYAIPFGAGEGHPDIPQSPLNSVMIYPNPAKDVETSDYPYAELLRDFSAALCRPNSVLVTYGYGFGDDHINRVIRDMLTIPSTHLVIISYDDASGRIPGFCKNVGHDAQTSLLIGDHFGDMQTIVDHYLPKPAIDQITWRETELLKKRGTTSAEELLNDSNSQSGDND